MERLWSAGRLVRGRAWRLSAAAAAIATGLVLWAGPAAGQTVVEYYHTDALGSVRAVADASGNVLRRHDFLPFGEEYAPTTPPPDKRLFTGKERDSETSLDYFGARYYRAEIGRFTTIDPVYTWSENLTDPQRWNRYAYVRNNPLKYVDPDGRVVVQEEGNEQERKAEQQVVAPPAVQGRSPQPKRRLCGSTSMGKSSKVQELGATLRLFELRVSGVAGRHRREA